MKFPLMLATIMTMILASVFSVAVPKKHDVDLGDIIGGGSIGFCGVPGASCNEKNLPIGAHDKDENVTVPDTPQFRQAMAELSSLFGWQFAGSALSNDMLDATCNNIASTGHYKWVGESLVPADIRDPICKVANMPLKPSRAVPYIGAFSTQLFITQLLNSFAADDVTSFATLCGLLPHVNLGNLFLNTMDITTAVCSAAKVEPSPAPVTAVPVLQHAVDAYKNMASILYGQIFASTATNDEEMNVNCAHAQNFGSSLTGVNLNATLVKYTICQVARPMTVAQGVNAIKTYSSSTYVTVLENLGPQDASYFLWLCKALDSDAMSLAGMDGVSIKAQICDEAGSSPI